LSSPVFYPYPATMTVSPPSSATRSLIKVRQECWIALTSVLRHGAERMSSMKVLFALGLVLETLGLDVGFSRLLLTFLLQ